MHFIHDEETDLVLVADAGPRWPCAAAAAAAHHNRVGDFIFNPLISLMNSFDISSHLPTTYYYYYYYNRRHLSPNLLHRTKKKNERACVRASLGE